MTLVLRGYQQRALEALSSYLASARATAANHAFVAATSRPYRAVPELPDIPYICLRIPTGGGKTLMASHAIGIVAEEYLRTERIMTLWLTPSNAIREQTLTRLKDQRDPYRKAVDERCRGPVSVLDLAEALSVTRGALDGENVVIVATLQAFRQDETEGRKVYEQNGALEHHFTGLSADQVARLSCRSDGTPIESLENVLRLRRPLIVMDEAHNARTRLSFETLARVAPSCILEFTATPEKDHRPEQQRFASNVLAHVSAAELKAEEMIKLPVRLRLRPDWSATVGEALAQQRVLEEVAGKERALTGEYIRPIVLFQAEANRQGDERVTAPVLKEALIRDHRVPEEQIAIATGGTDELAGVNLSASDCPIRFVITQAALREGWDCPFAYILCSIANQGGARAVEQILGRVLRLPGARRKRHDTLNSSYAFVVSTSFETAASNLKDALVENGFEKFDAEAALQALDAPGIPLFGATPEQPVQQVVTVAPSPDVLEKAAARGIRFDPKTRSMTATAPMTAEAERILMQGFASSDDKRAVATLARASRGEVVAPAAPGVDASFVMPKLTVVREGRRTIFDESAILEAEWDLDGRDGTMPAAIYARQVRQGAAVVVDVTQHGQLTISAAEEAAAQLSAIQGERGWTAPQLAAWLDRRIAHPDLDQWSVLKYIQKVLDGLMVEGVGIDQLARDKFRLRVAIESRVQEFRHEERGKTFQRLLFGTEAVPKTSPELGDLIHKDTPYPFNWAYEGALQLPKHLFTYIGELSDTGEEFACAVKIAHHPEVMVWVRNLPRRAGAFWLQTSTDKFYPDFIGLLKDGRVFAVEFKGAHLATAEDAREKRKLGDLWAAASEGKAVFVMPTDTSFNDIDSAFG